MPIYEYRCSTCGFENEFLRKISEPPLEVCPECGKATFTKKVTAAGFHLKGTGWYVTDFRGGPKPKDDSKAQGEAKSAESAKSTETAKPTESATTKGASATAESS